MQGFASVAPSLSSIERATTITEGTVSMVHSSDADLPEIIVRENSDTAQQHLEVQGLMDVLTCKY